MGAITSKQTSEIQKESTAGNDSCPVENVTPRNTRVLPFDPRSPSENVNRTPITVLEVSEKETPNVRNLKALPIDPMSPTVEVTRTPLLVEEIIGKKYQPLKPSKLTEIPFLPNAPSVSKDPRSPSDKVPRTPLEEGRDANKLLLPNETKSDQTPTHFDHDKKDPKINLNSLIFDQADNVSDRKPLTDLQNRTSSQLRNQLPALHFRNVEEEFAKSEKLILNKLESEDKELKTTTDFVETI